MLKERERVMRQTEEKVQVRAASLARRDNKLNPNFRIAWALGWTAWFFGTVATFCNAMAHLDTSMRRPAGWIFLVGFASWGVFWLLVGQFAARRAMLEPEPMPPDEATDLAKAYTAEREWRAWVFYLMSLMAVVLGIALGLLLTGGMTRATIWVGAGGGSLIGIMGGIFGTLADVRRARLRRRYQDLAKPAES